MDSKTESVETSRILFKEELIGHKDWVTCISADTSAGSLSFVTGSRDKNVIIWDKAIDGISGWVKRKSLSKNKGIVQDVLYSAKNNFIVIGSWDKTVHLWNPKENTTIRLQGHTQDVTAVSVSPDSKFIASSSRDNTIKVWDNQGTLIKTFGSESNCHNGWVTTLKFIRSENEDGTEKLGLISGGWDGVIKIWNLVDEELVYDLQGSAIQINQLDVTPEFSICAGAGHDGILNFWEIESGTFLYSIANGESISAVKFNPMKLWVATSSKSGIKVWDLETKKVIEKLVPPTSEDRKNTGGCVSLEWSIDGAILYAGYTDGTISVWTVGSSQ